MNERYPKTEGYIKSEWRLEDQPNGDRINGAAAEKKMEEKGWPTKTLYGSHDDACTVWCDGEGEQQGGWVVNVDHLMLDPILVKPILDSSR